jgi:hypothetical protein
MKKQDKCEVFIKSKTTKKTFFKIEKRYNILVMM